MEESSLHQHMGNLKDDLARLRSDLADVARTMMDAGKETSAEAKAKLEAKAREQIDQLARAMSTTRERGRLAAGKLCDQIEERPMASVLTALGVGFLVGLIINNRK